jgi:hypothetical protein
MAMSYPGRVKDGVVILDPPTELPDGTRVRVQPVAEDMAGATGDTGPRPAQPQPDPIDSSAYWRSPSFGELAAEQNVQIPTTFEDALGGWPDDEADDGFEDAVAQWRHGDR